MPLQRVAFEELQHLFNMESRSALASVRALFFAVAHVLAVNALSGKHQGRWTNPVPKESGAGGR